MTQKIEAESPRSTEPAGFEQLVSELLTRLVECPAAAVDEEIRRAQRRVCEDLGLDRSTLWRATGKADGPFLLTHCHGLDLPTSPAADAARLFPWTLERVLRGQVVVVSRAADLPAEATRDCRTWERTGTRSTVVVPLATGSGRVLGALSFDTVEREFEWRPEMVRRLQLVAGVFAGALARDQSVQARQAAEARFLKLLASMREAFVSVTMDGRLEEFNDAYQQMLAYPREELQALTYEDLTPARWHAFEADIIEKQVLVRDVSDVYVKEYRRKDGTVFPVELRTFLIRDSSSRPQGMWAIVRDITERRQAEEALRLSEERLRHAAQAARIGIFDHDLVAGTTYWSPELRAIVGLSADEPSSALEVVPSFVHPDDVERVGQDFRRALDPEGGGAMANDHRVVWPDGTVRWVQFRGQAEFAGEGDARRAVRISGTALDITERKQAEEALRQSHEYYETVLEKSPIGFAVHTIDDGVGRFVSATYESLYGCERGAIGSHLTFFETVWPRHPGLRDEIKARVVADMTSGDPSRMRWEDVPIPLPSGETRYVSAMNIPFAERNLMVSTVWDVTDRVVAERRLRESELRFRQVAESVSDFIWEVDERGLYTYTSPSVERILGYTPDELVGKMCFWELFAPESREERKAAALAAFAAGQPFRAFPNANLSKSGRIVHLETSGVPLVDEAGVLRGYRGADTDVTERRRAEELAEAERKRLQAERDYLQREMTGSNAPGVVGTSPAIVEVLAQIEQVAPTTASVLITGETGTGKERLAHAVHQLSPRRDRLMVTVNCAALPATLIESELFGHEKGAYTGAVESQIGRFELADGSTLFLDEVAELPLELQAKLLRVLETGEFERLGSPRRRKTDVRLVAATNRDLAQAVRAGRFRQDLFYRLNVFPVRIPPLRERREDIPSLVWAFTEYFAHVQGKAIDSVSPQSLLRLQEQPWPGNVRELRNVIERAVILSSGGVLDVRLPPSPAAPAAAGTGEAVTLEESERRHILEVLKRTGGRIAGKGGAAEILGVNRTTLQSRMKKLGLTRPRG